MQTFLPYEDFESSLAALDCKRLGKQRVEARQILSALTIESYGWKNHPATKMWAGYEEALKHYSNMAIQQWIARGYKNTMEILDCKVFSYPWWLGGKIHSTHRSALLYKDYEEYKDYEWTEKPELNYYWPIQEIKNG